MTANEATAKKRYRWIDLHIPNAIEGDTDRSVLVNEEMGWRLSTIEKRRDGAWEVISHNVLEGHVFCDLETAQRAVCDLFEISPEEIFDW